MKIKEVEKLTGITAKNIRFYEQQGLLSPTRNRENSYRDYDDGDIRTIKTIKILRKLDMSLENIREVLHGEQPLDVVIAQQTEYLEQSIRTLEAAKKLCQEIAAERPQIESFDVDGCLARMDTMEAQGGSFANIMNDFLAVAGAVEKMRFHFYPDELITTPQEFTEALFQYANEHKLDITITKECMYPEFILDGIEYVAMRYTGRYGSVISVEAKEPDGLLPKNIPHQRRWWMEWGWRTGFPMLVVFAIAGFMVGGGVPLLVAFVGVIIAALLITAYNNHK